MNGIDYGLDVSQAQGIDFGLDVTQKGLDHRGVDFGLDAKGVDFQNETC